MSELWSITGADDTTAALPETALETIGRTGDVEAARTLLRNNPSIAGELKDVLAANGHHHLFAEIFGSEKAGSVGRTHSCVNATKACTHVPDSDFQSKLPPVVRALEERVIKRLYGEKTTLADISHVDEYHSYATTSELCDRYCDPDLAAEVFLSMPAPRSPLLGGPVQDGPVKTGDKSDATAGSSSMLTSQEGLLKGLDLAGWVPGGPVEHLVAKDEGITAVANVTLKGHQLHPGYVVRWIETTADGGIQVHTFGRGIGGYGGVNDYAGRNIFEDLDQRMQRVYVSRDAKK